MNIFKKAFYHRHYRATVVLLYHPEQDIRTLYQYAVKHDKSLGPDDSREDWQQINAMVVSMNPNRRIYILIGKHSTVAELVHESLHVTSQLFLGIGSEHTQDTEENFAYAQTVVFEDCFDFICKHAGSRLSYFLRQK